MRDGLLVKIGTTSFVLPLSLVEKYVELSREDVDRAHGRHMALILDVPQMLDGLAYDEDVIRQEIVPETSHPLWQVLSVNSETMEEVDHEMVL